MTAMVDEIQQFIPPKYIGSRPAADFTRMLARCKFKCQPSGKAFAPQGQAADIRLFICILVSGPLVDAWVGSMATTS